MNINTQGLGRLGEDQAISFLKKKGYRILERNFRNRLGELDVVASEEKTICFIEVKTRATNYYGTPHESISRQKMRKLSKLALSYLKYKGWHHVNARFDVVLIQKTKDQTDTIELVRNAFDLIE